MDTLEALRTRRSVRAYTLKAVDRQTIESIVDCGRLAPSAMNQQKWEFVAVTDRDRLAALAATSDAGGFVRDAGAAIAVVMDETPLLLADAACAATCMMLAARSMEIGSCWFHCYDKPFEKAVADILNVPAPLRVVCVLGLGYGSVPPPPPKRPLDKVLHWELLD